MEVGKGGLGDFRDNTVRETLFFGETAFLDLDGGSVVEVGVEAGEFFDGSLVEVGSGRKLVEVGGFFDDSLV